ncbi:hypothetical protein Tco_0581315, partial [Tanacetum coccineum]
HAGKTNVLTTENINALTYGLLGAFLQTHGGSDILRTFFCCALNYSKLGEADSLLVWREAFKASNKEYVARIRGKLIQKLLLNQKCMGYLVRAYYSISPTKYYKDNSCWSADLKSNTTEDVITI